MQPQDGLECRSLLLRGTSVCVPALLLVASCRAIVRSDSFVTTSTSYQLQHRKAPNSQKWERNRQKKKRGKHRRKIGQKIRYSIFRSFFSCFLDFGVFYSVAGRRGRNAIAWTPHIARNLFIRGPIMGRWIRRS